MVDIFMSWNKKVAMREVAMFYEDKLRELQGKQDAMINDLNEQISRLQEKIKELDGKIVEYEKQMDKHEEVLDLFTSTDNERMTYLLRQLVNEIKPPIYDYFGKLIDRNYDTIAGDINRRLKEIAYNLSKQIDEEVEQKILSVIAKKHIIKVVNVDAETARRVEGGNDDKPLYL